MTYQTNSTRPALISQQIDNVNVPKMWVMSGTDADATVLAAGYISDAGALGLAVGDILFYILTSTPEIYLHVVTAINATTGAATLGGTPAVSL